MKALYFSQAPSDVEALKEKDPNRFTITGRGVYFGEVFKALLRHGTFDHIILPARSVRPGSPIQNSPVFVDNLDRIKFVSEYEMECLQDYSRVVFMTPDTVFQNETRLRQLSGCERAPITGTIHSLYGPMDFAYMLLLLVAPLTSHDAVICSSSAGKDVLRTTLEVMGAAFGESAPALRPRFQTPVIPLGVDVSDFEKRVGSDALKSELGLPDGPAVLYFGRFSLSFKADLLPLILAFGRVHAKHPNTSLILAGDDTQYRMADALKEFAAEMAPGATVSVIPNPDARDKRRLYAAADVFVSPSDSLQETFGITVIEAMSASLPVIAADWNGYKDLVRSGVNGIRVRTTLPSYNPRFDDLRGAGSLGQPDLLAATTMVDVAELANAIEILVSNPERRRSMGSASHERARAEFDWSVVIRAYEDLWEELASRAPSTRDSRFHIGLSDNLFSYRDRFAGYGTGFLTDGSLVRIAPASDWDRLSKWLLHGLRETGWFKIGMFEAIVETLKDGHWTEASTLLDSLGPATQIENVFNTAHLCRLIKYGVIELAPADGDSLNIQSDCTPELAEDSLLPSANLVL